MANLPVPSLQTGGLWWFQDLTVSDPIYVLPLVVTATMWCVLEVSWGWPSAEPARKRGRDGVVFRMCIVRLPLSGEGELMGWGLEFILSLNPFLAARC